MIEPNISSNKNRKCINVATGFCDLVEMFGGSAYSAAKTPTTTTALSTTRLPITTFKPTTETVITTTKSPAEIAKYITHQVPLICYNHSKQFFDMFSFID